MPDHQLESESAGESQNEPQPPTSPEPRQPSPGDGLVRPARGFVRFLYSSNPFYILSADLVFVGLKISFGSQGPASQTWALLFGLGGYTLLMAATACFLIRAGKLWDDLRSLLILIVMMFMTMAMSTDDTLAVNPAKGTLGCLGGLLFAVVVTESVLRTIGLRLPGWYRAAYYLILALIFLYPILLIRLASEPESPLLQWALFGFPVLSGLVLTALVPAAWGGPIYVVANGSPWRWPLFPWSLFLIMAGGLAVRSSSLCVSFHYVGGSRTIFGPYFLVPIGLAVSLIWLEIGIASGRRGVMFLASALPLLLAGTCLYGHRFEPVYQYFLHTFMRTLGGSPAFLTLIAAAVFYLYAAVRKVPLACEFLCVALIGLGMVGPHTVIAYDLDQSRPVPVLAAGLLLGSIAWRRHSAFRAATAACLLVLSGTDLCAQVWPAAPLASIAIHLTMAALLVLGAGFDNWLRDLAQVICPMVLAALGVGAVFRLPMIEPFVPMSIISWYPLLAIVIAATYGVSMRQMLFTASAVFTLASWVLDSGLHGYQQLRRLFLGLDEILAGILFFIVALAISLRKAGLVPPIEIGPLIRRIRVTVPEVGPDSYWEADDVGGDEPSFLDTQDGARPAEDIRRSSP